MSFRALGIAVAVAMGGTGCGKDVLVSSWELRLTASPDAGDEAEPAAPDAGGLPFDQAQAAQDARNHAHKEDKDHDGRSNSADKARH